MRLKKALRLSFLKQQGRRCAICRTPIGESAHLDHDHVKNIFRGALCVSCNRGLGFFCDSVELLQQAIQYLKTPRILRYPREIIPPTGAQKGNTHALGYRHSASTIRFLKKFQRRSCRSKARRLATSRRMKLAHRRKPNWRS
jgi:hypothetical protein